MDVIFAPGDKMNQSRQHHNWANTSLLSNIDHLRDDARWAQIIRNAKLHGNGVIRANYVRSALIALNGIEVPVDVVRRLTLSLGYTCAELKEIGPRHQLLTLCEQGLVRIVRHA